MSAESARRELTRRLRDAAREQRMVAAELAALNKDTDGFGRRLAIARARAHRRKEPKGSGSAMSDKPKTFKPLFRCPSGRHLHGVVGNRHATLERVQNGKSVQLEADQELVHTTVRGGEIEMRTLRKGPARASNANYRKGYDAIFGKQPRGQA